jgi:hypothetical protein
VDDAAYFSFFTTQSKIKFKVNGSDKDIVNYRVKDIPYIKKNLPFKYLNPIMHADARFIERYLEKDHKLKHLPKEIKDHYFKGQNFDLEKLFKDTLFIIEQNFKYNDRYVLIDSSADSFDMREVNDKEAIFSKKELLMIKNSPR